MSLALVGCEEETPTGIRFSHEQHLGTGFGCGLCHLSFSYSEPRRPPEKVCAYCHTIGDHARPQLTCAACHTRTDFTSEGVRRPTYGDSKFTHEAHLAAGVGCQDCHVNQVEAVVYEDIVFPRMKGCMNCHARYGASKECVVCHQVWRADVLPESHTNAWLERHGMVSVTELETNCDYCHSNKDFCQDCHMAEPPKSHTLFFRNRGHGFHAETDRLRCEPCHQQDFCLSCHDVEEGVRPASHVAGFGRKPYLHCASCHFPTGEANGCNTCHTADRIKEAHLVAVEEKDFQIPPLAFELRSCLDGCHPFERTPLTHPVAALVNAECLICHFPAD